MLLSFTAIASASDSLFTVGNKFYEQKDYPQAIETYNLILAENFETATLYFNSD